MNKKQKMIIASTILIVVGVVVYFTTLRDAVRKNKVSEQIVAENNGKKTEENQEPLNEGNINPISGLACENWNRRPIAVMQPSDLQARPAAGFSEADMVFELPAYTSSVTRLLGVYSCAIPKEIGAMRSARHDHIALAGAIDAFFIHWGGSHFALDLLNKNVIDRIDCMTTNYCERWDWQNDATMRMEDSGHIKGEKALAAMNAVGGRAETKFAGYPHQKEASLENRGNGGELRVAFASPYDVNYTYDRETNTFLRTWNDVADIDRNNKERLAPKNIVVMFAKSEQITNTQDYTGKGLKSPWEGVEEVKNTGAESISGRYNNVQIGDPWYDESGSGEAYYYMNGKEYRGTWKKDSAKLESKLFFYDESGKEIMFIPGQIWVEILEPGQVLRWTPAS
ncbi:MAG: hypothetical protein UR66_C0003G0144 [Candidatus Moranbacteria bacterium GW2011_GWE1_35_17]|nr:MAG: hypothetical protein UR66_C0003G0144 [Candidatus Moranbacteria bacterium GW2011_GWE1_35_17]